MSLFTPAQLDKINKSAEKSKQAFEKPVATKTKTINADLNRISAEVTEYFKDSPAILITSKSQLHDYISKCIEYGYAGIDTETTGLDRIRDTIVGASLYVPGMPECYIPSKHIVPIFNQPYPDQLSYVEIGQEFQRLVDAEVKMIFANADFDISMMYKDFHVDFSDVCYFDVITAWRCLKEDELDNTLKSLYNKYCLKGKGDPKHFSDFFPPSLFPFCKPGVAKLYAANDAKITFEFFLFELQYLTKSNPKCQKAHLEKIADLYWNIEVPMIKVCAMLHRRGAYVQKSTADALAARYHKKMADAEATLADMVQKVIDRCDYSVMINAPFKTGAQFGYNSSTHVKFLCFNMLGLEKASSMDKEQLALYNNPVTDQILACRGLQKLVGTYVDKLPKETTKDSRIHAQFKSIGADCIVGNSIVPTDKGYRTIEGICESAGCKEGEHVDVSDLTIINKDQTFEPAQSVIRYTDYPTIQITTEYGFCIEGTYNHPIMTFEPEKDREFKHLEELHEGDYVEIPCNYSTGVKWYVKTNLELGPIPSTNRRSAKMPEYYTKEFAEFLGMYHSSGSVAFPNHSYEISIASNSDDVHKRVSELSSNLFDVLPTHLRYEGSKEEETVISCMQIRDIDRILLHGKFNKRIPDAIWSSPTSVINSYIRGMTLDSIVSSDDFGKPTMSLRVVNDLDANFIRCHLASQGILCRQFFNGEDANVLSFDAYNYSMFRRTIGFVERDKYVYVKVPTDNMLIKRRVGDSFRLKIKSITYRRNTVYDLHVPDTHSFISNGMISHNTGRMASSSPNLQNIPSHATDIRHMFRATAENDFTLEAETNEDDTSVTFTVDNGCKLYTERGLVFAPEVVVGDIVVAEDTKKQEVKLRVNKIEVKGSSSTVCYDVI